MHTLGWDSSPSGGTSCLTSHTSFCDGWNAMKWIPHHLAKGILLVNVDIKGSVAFYLATDHTFWRIIHIKVVRDCSEESDTGEPTRYQMYDSHLAMWRSSGWVPSNSVFPPFLWVMQWFSFCSSSCCASLLETVTYTSRNLFLSITEAGVDSEV